MGKDTRDQEIKDYKGGDKIVQQHQKDEGKTSYSQWVEDQHNASQAIDE